jgi:sulfur-carrier protein
MEIEVSLPNLLRDSTYRKNPLPVTGDTVGEALRNLLDRYPLLRIHLYDEQGDLRPHVLIYYNDDNIAWLDSLDTPLRPGDHLHILQAVSGG